MDLKSGYAYWAVRNALMYAFPPLDAEWHCDVGVVGADITGALIAGELAGRGHDPVDSAERGWLARTEMRASPRSSRMERL